MKELIYWDDIWTIVEFSYEEDKETSHPNRVYYTAYEGLEENTTPLVECEVIFDGYSKWDGCSDILFTQGNYHHMCDVNREIRQLSLALMRVHNYCCNVYKGEDEYVPFSEELMETIRGTK